VPCFARSLTSLSGHWLSDFFADLKSQAYYFAPDSKSQATYFGPRLKESGYMFVHDGHHENTPHAAPANVCRNPIGIARQALVGRISPYQHISGVPHRRE